MKANYVTSSVGTLKKVLLCTPDFLALKPINKIASDWINKGIPLDLNKCRLEHNQLVKIYEENKIQTDILEASKEYTSQVFSRDFGFMLKEGCVIGRFKEVVRQGETKKYEEKIQELSIPIIARCTEGFLEGGDFWQLDSCTLAIGVIARSNLQGIRNIAEQLKPYGYTIIPVEADEKFLHLDMIFNRIGDRLAVVCLDALPLFFKNYLTENGYDLINISEAEVFKHFCNLQALGEKKVISLKSNIKVNDALRSRGYKVFELDSEEILKTGGGPHCMTFPLDRD